MIAVNEMNLLQMIFGGSWVGVAVMLLLLTLSMVSLYYIVDHFLTIRQQRLFPDSQLDQIEQLIAAKKIDEAIDFCYQRDHDSMAGRIIGAGLQRYRNSQFGFAEYRSAVEEAGDDETSKLFRRTEVLANHCRHRSHAWPYRNRRRNDRSFHDNRQSRRRRSGPRSRRRNRTGVGDDLDGVGHRNAYDGRLQLLPP